MQPTLKRSLGRTAALCGVLLSTCTVKAVAQITQTRAFVLRGYNLRGYKLLAAVSADARKRLSALMPNLSRDRYNSLIAELTPDSMAYVRAIAQFQRDSITLVTLSPPRYQIIEQRYGAVGVNLRIKYNALVSSAEAESQRTPPASSASKTDFPDTSPPNKTAPDTPRVTAKPDLPATTPAVDTPHKPNSIASSTSPKIIFQKKKLRLSLPPAMTEFGLKEVELLICLISIR